MRSRIFNVDFEQATLNSAVQQIISAAQIGSKGLVVTPNVDHIVMLQTDAEMRRIYHDALFRYADGMPIVWFSKLLPNLRLPERVTGADLLPAVCKKAAASRLNIYFLGGNPGVAKLAQETLCRQYPNLTVVGTWCPPFGFENDIEETDRIISDINTRDVNILFIGVGAPKQEKWAAAHLDRLNVGPVLCVGAAFDFAAGTTKRAPRSIQKCGLEWLWRLGGNPGRLWKRYLLRDSRFFLLALKEFFYLWQASKKSFRKV